MAKKEKNKTTNIILIILIPILILVMIGAMFFSILDWLIDLIKNIIEAFINAILGFLKNPAAWIAEKWATFTNWLDRTIGAGETFDSTAYEEYQTDPTVVITEEEFDDIKEELEKNINRDIAGLNDIMLKKMVLTYNAGMYLNDTEVLIELKASDFGLSDNDEMWIDVFNVERYDEAGDLLGSAALGAAAGATIGAGAAGIGAGPGAAIGAVGGLLAELLDGADHVKFTLNSAHINNNQNYFKGAKPFTIVEGTPQEDGVGKDGYLYLKTKGMVDINVDATGENLIYYGPHDGEELLDKIYEKEYLGTLITNPDYAESVREYLGKCYTYTEDGIKMYSQKVYKYTEKTIEYENESKFADENTFHVIEDIADWWGGTSYTRKRNITPTNEEPIQKQVLDYKPYVEDYAVPVELLVSLLEITSSEEFVNSFMEMAVSSDYYVKLNLYETNNVEEEIITKKKNVTTNVRGNITYTVKALQRDPWGLGNEIVSLTGANQNICTAIHCETGWDKFNGHIKLEIPKEKVIANGDRYYVRVTANDGEFVVFEDWIGDAYDWLNNTWYLNWYGGKKSKTKTDTGDIIELEKIRTKTDKYAIGLIQVKTWYVDVTYENEVEWSKKFETLTKDSTTGALYRREVARCASGDPDPWNSWWEFFQAECLGGDWIEESVPTNEKTKIYTATDNSAILTKREYADIESEYKTNAANMYFGGYSLEQCLNAQFNVVIQNKWDLGFLETYDYSKYKWNSMTVNVNSLKTKTGYITETEVLREGVYGECGTPSPVENFNKFLALLRDESKNSKKYETLYGEEIDVGARLVTTDGMLYELLRSSQNAQGYVEILKYALNKYKNGETGTATFNYNIYKTRNMVPVS